MNLIELPILLRSGIIAKWHKVSDHSVDMCNLLLVVNIKSWAEKDHAMLDLQPVFECTLDIKLSNWSEEYLSEAFLLPYINERLPYMLTREDPVNKFYVWNWQTKQWEDPRTLADFKEAQWTQIKQARSQAEYAGFTWDGSIFDSDANSQARITGAVSLALIAKQSGQPYSITWTLADNTLRVLSADDMISVGLALGTHIQTIFNKGQQLQQQIEAATTKEEIESISW